VRVIALAGLCTIATLAASARSARAQGTALSGPTDGDGNSAFWNPAAMTRVSGTLLEADLGASLIRLGYTPDGQSDGSRSFLLKPDLGGGVVTDAPGKKIRLGLSWGAPYGDGAAWPRDGAANNVTRYFLVEGKIVHYTLTPAAALEATPWLSVGIGLDIVYSTIDATFDKDLGKELNVRLNSPAADSPFPYADPQFATPAHLEGQGMSLAYKFGVLVQPNDRVTIGAAFHSGATTQAEGWVHADYPPQLVELVRKTVPEAQLPDMNGTFRAPLDLPMRLMTSIAIQTAPRWELKADYKFTQTSAVSNLEVNILRASTPDIHDAASISVRRDGHDFGLRLLRQFGAGGVGSGVAGASSSRR
jgi:long-subunit fatty acid transport protein